MMMAIRMTPMMTTNINKLMAIAMTMTTMMTRMMTIGMTKLIIYAYMYYMILCKVVQLSLQPHSRRLATLGLKTINFCLCLTVIGWRYYVHTRQHDHHHQDINIIINRRKLCIRPVYWDLSCPIGEGAWRHWMGLQILSPHLMASSHPILDSLSHWIILLCGNILLNFHDIFRTPLVLLCLLRNLRLLAPVTSFATLAEVFILCSSPILISVALILHKFYFLSVQAWALVVVFYYLFCDPLPPTSSRPLFVGLGCLSSSPGSFFFSSSLESLNFFLIQANPRQAPPLLRHGHLCLWGHWDCAASGK